MDNLARRSQNQASAAVKGTFTVFFQATLTVLSLIAVGWILSNFLSFFLAWAVAVLVGCGAWFFLDQVIWQKDPVYIQTAHPDVEFELVSGGRLLTDRELEQKQREIKSSRRFLEAGAFVVPEQDEPKGFAYVGAPGAGKTLNIRLHMQATLPEIGKGRNHRALIYD